MSLIGRNWGKINLKYVYTRLNCHFFTMSRDFYNNRKKGSNVNKPRARERLQELRESSGRGGNFGPSSSDVHKNKSGDSKNRPPPGLKGKALGLWYRDRNRQQEIKSFFVELDQGRLNVIENLLTAVGSSNMITDDAMREGDFKESFLRKINVTFEEKLENFQNVRLEGDNALDQELFDEINKKRKQSEQYKEMLEFRKSLPSYQKRKEILNLINQNQIVLVSGETGCGKTTQVVQYVLDDFILNRKGSLCNAVCTQPRRISAVSVAERVAAERGEKIGESVGYVIRLESEMPKRRRGAITFVTTGILIQWLQSNPSLSEITHLFIDEIHERDTLCDFLICLLKYILPKRPDLKVILMSATINAELFSDYFGGIPCIEIPGLTYPVEELYLEDILQKVPFKFPDPKKMSHRSFKQVDYTFQNHVIPYATTLAKSNKYSTSVITELRNPESELLNINFVTAVILHVCTHEPEGAILVFVPGLSDIQDLYRSLSQKLFSSSKCKVIALHSIMPTINQKEAFVRPPKGVRKIVISTTIAETSLTIDDVVYVIDCGKLKVKNFDLKINVSTLEPEWETVANARQRRGRAGRTQPGKCYKLFTRAREETFEPFPIPEMKRSRLEDVIISAKFLQLGKVEPFLNKVMDPPDPEAVKLSLKLLRTLNVLDSEEKLTPLGFHLAKLPVGPQMGKMMLMGALFGCIDPILSIVACLSFKDPFVFIFGKEHLVHEQRKQFTLGEKSDHFMLSEVFQKWEEAEADGHGYNFAKANYLSYHNMKLMKNMKKQFAEYLYKMNFLASSDPKHRKSNINSFNHTLIKAIVCSGLYPNVAMIKKIVKKKKDPNHSRIFWKTMEHHKVDIHIKSVLTKVRNFESPFLVYFGIVKSSGIFLHDVTMVHPMPLLFFGENLNIVVEGKGYCIRVDDMIKFSCFKRTAVLVQKLRNQLLWILETAISNPGVIDWEREDERTIILRAIVELITSEADMPLTDFVEFGPE